MIWVILLMLMKELKNPTGNGGISATTLPWVLGGKLRPVEDPYLTDAEAFESDRTIIAHSGASKNLVE